MERNNIVLLRSFFVLPYPTINITHFTPLKKSPDKKGDSIGTQFFSFFFLFKTSFFTNKMVSGTQSGLFLRENYPLLCLRVNYSNHFSTIKILIMNAYVISQDEFRELLDGIQEIKEKVNRITAPSEAFITNATFIKLMDISARTAQEWRQRRLIGFSKQGKQIYYRLSDIEQFLKERHYDANALQKYFEEIQDHQL